MGELQATCRCNTDSVPGVVLDPFMGTGTTALAAEKHGRDWLGIELNAEYAAMAEQRLAAQRAKQGHGRAGRHAPVEGLAA
jgi:site-specific DNA-methyltransferase (adenine-specific)